VITNKVWFDASCVSSNNGISRDGKVMLSRLQELGTIEILNWPKIPFLDSNRTRKFLNLLLLSTTWSPRIPRRFDGHFYQQQVGPLRSRKDNKWIIRTHDIFPVTNPEWFYWWTSRTFSRSLKVAVREKATFRCVSEQTKSELLRLYPDVNENAFVDRCEVTVLDKKLCNACVGCTKIGIGDSSQYVISVGTLEPRKNYRQVIRLAESLPEIKFVLIGNRGWKSDFEIKKLRLGITNIEWTSSCCDGALNNFYLRASLFLSTSLDEGFNLPALEARELYNLPLVLSDIPVHREIHTGFAEFFTSDQEAIQLIEKFFKK
jgi:glycosyltransferase involved in cell wall biosynthesis